MIWELSSQVVALGFFIPLALSMMWVSDVRVVSLGVAFIFLLGIILSLNSGSITPFSVFVTLAIGLFFIWIFGRIGADVRLMINAGDVKASQIAFSAARSLAFTTPAILLVWISFDIAELSERRAMYGCSASEPLPTSVYGLTVSSDMFYARPRLSEPPLENSQRFLLAREPERTPSWMPMYQEGPLFWMINGTGYTSAIVGTPCPKPEASLHHERSAITSVSNITERIQKSFGTRFASLLDEGERRGDNAEIVARRALFGTPGHACRPDARGIFPDDAACIFGQLPRSCGLRRWVFRTGECIERMIKRPIHRTYERWHRNLYETYLQTYAASDAAQDASFEQVERDVSSFVENELTVLEEQANQRIRTIFWTWAIAGWLGIVSAISFIAKTFLTLLSRSVFSDENTHNSTAKQGAQMRLLDPSEVDNWIPIDKTTQLKPMGHKGLRDGDGFRAFTLSIPSSRKSSDTWYAYDNCGVSWSKYGRTLIFFRPFDVWLRRLRAGKATVHQLESVGNLNEVAGRLQHDVAVVELEIREGQAAIIDLRKVLAFQGSIRFKSIFLPRLGAFFQHRLLYTSAQTNGRTGRLLMVGNGQAMSEVFTGGADGFIEPESMAVMDICGTFKGAASLGWFSQFYRPTTLGPADSATLLLASNENSNVAIGLMARLKGIVWFLLPI